jgi:UDP-N-acetylmuramyl pentapeptide phosphotransferase/UDP-N-acetylglucosamine-1-phosphate transferase
MPGYIFPLISFVVSLLVTAVGMPPLLHLCQVCGLYDMPNERKVHHNKIPRLGGIFFAPAMIVGLVVSFLVMSYTQPKMPQFGMPTFYISVGIFLIYIVGLIDDILGLKASLKFLIQFISALFLPICGVCLNNLYGLFGVYEIPMAVGYPLTVFIALVIINSINLIDGIDGLAGSLSVVALTTFSVLFYQLDVVSYAMLGAGLCGAVLAFLYYNMLGDADRNTKTFMGDTGSLILGYALAFFAIKYAMDNSPRIPFRRDALLVSVTLLWLPTIDLTRVAIGRLCHGVSMFHADKTHIHHLLLGTGLTMHQTLAVIVGLQLGFMGLGRALSTMGLAVEWIGLAYILVYVLLVVFLQLCRREEPPTAR